MDQHHRYISIALFTLVNPVLASSPTFDQRTWTIGYDAADSTQHITEYVVPPDTVKSWTELITSQIIADPNHNLKLSALVSQIKSGFGRDCREFKWEILKESEESVMLEWSHNGCVSFPPQYEVSSLSICKSGICRWAYATKVVPVTEEVRASWRQIVGNLRQNQ